MHRLTTLLFCAWKTGEQRRESHDFWMRLKQWESLAGSELPPGMASLWDQEGCGDLVPYSNQIMCRWSHRTANSIMGQPRFWGCKTCIPTLPQPLPTSGENRHRSVNFPNELTGTYKCRGTFCTLGFFKSMAPSSWLL